MNHLLTGFLSAACGGDRRSGRADGLIAVTPIFNASYSGLFKLFFDVVERDGLAEMPTLLAATGGSARHSLAIDHAMRPLFAYLNAAVVATGVYAAAEDWGRAGIPADAGLVERIDRAAAEPLARSRRVPRLGGIHSSIRCRSGICSTPARRATGPPDPHGQARTASRRSVSTALRIGDHDSPRLTNPTRSHIRAAASFATAVNEWTTR